MVKIIFLVFCVIAAFCESSASTNIECDYADSYYATLGVIYQCEVIINPIILTEESAEIRGINGTHERLKSNNDVIAFYAELETIQFFPKRLEYFLKNLKVIDIVSCQLKEIHQADLKVFPNLVYLYLEGNGIEVIEAGLFEFNPNLEAVGFREPKIKHIDPNVFDHLYKLSYFWFGEAPCVGKDIEDSTEQVQEILKVVKFNCSNSEYLSLEN